MTAPDYRQLLRLLPNALTLSRLLLAAPLGACIAQDQLGWALLIAVAAGLTDALDGYLARRLGALSRFGAALDPIADKSLVFAAFVGLAWAGLIPWLVTAIVILRDAVIVAGAAAYLWFIGQLEYTPTRLSKVNTAIQLAYLVITLGYAVLLPLNSAVHSALSYLVIMSAIVTGVQYVVTWSGLAYREKHNARR